MGDSITVGVDYETVSSGGYRDPLFRDLSAVGFAFNYVGINNSQSTMLLTNAGQQMHNGFGGWHIQDLDANLDGVAVPIGGGDSNNGGYLVTGGHGTGRSALLPDLLLLEVGTNDVLQGTPNLNQALYGLVTHFHALSPNTTILVAGITPINSVGLTAQINAYNTYIKTQLAPSLSYVQYVDQNTAFLKADGSVNENLLGTDNIHPNRYGYPVIAQTWATAIESLRGIAPTKHMLTVNGGSGSGSYPAGSVVTVMANAPAANQQFASWSPAQTALSNPFSSLATYTMPAADAVLSANDAVQGSTILPNGTYEIVSSFNGLAATATGTVSQSQMQQQVYASLTATQEWSVINLGGNVVTFTLPGTNEALEVPAALSSTLAAKLDIAPYAGSANQQWIVTPSNGSFQLVNGSSGQVVNVQDYSAVPGSPLLQYTAGFSDDLWVFYPMSGAVLTYPLTVNQGTGGGMYAAGTAVSVSASAPASGSQFASWTGAVSGLASVSAATTSYMMSASASTLTATYIPVVTTYPLAVTGGSGSGMYAAGTMVSVSAIAASSGFQFAGWTGTTNALADASQPMTTVVMPAGAVAITASFATIPNVGTTVVGIQFVGGGASPLHGPGYDYTAGAGRYAAAHWNPTLNTGDTTTRQNLNEAGVLNDSTGAPTSIGFHLQSSGAYYTGAGTGFVGGAPYPGYPGQMSGAGDRFLYAGFAYAGYSDTTPLTLTINGLQASHHYTILAYVTPFAGFGTKQTAKVTLAGVSYYVLIDGTAGNYERAVSTTAENPGIGNYVEFDNITGSDSQVLTLVNTGALTGLSGFQVVDMEGSSTTEMLTVTGGSGSGTYAQGNTVAVTANAEAGYQFSGWTGATGTLANVQAATTTVTIPASSVAITATYVAAGGASTPGPTGVSSIVSIQFVGGGAAPLHGTSYDYTAGVFTAGNWNPLLITGNTITPQNLITSGLKDSTGATSGLGLSLAASGAYYTGAGMMFSGAPPYPNFPGRSSGAGDSFLYSGFGYAGYSNSAPLSLTVIGLKPGNTYSLLVYLAPFEPFGDNQTATIALASGTGNSVSITGKASTYKQAVAIGGSVPGNYVRFDGLTGLGSQTVTLTNTSWMVGVSGVQVVDFGSQ